MYKSNIKKNIWLIISSTIVLLLLSLIKSNIRGRKEVIKGIIREVNDEKKIIELLDVQIIYLRSPKILQKIYMKNFYNKLTSNNKKVVKWSDFCRQINGDDVKKDDNRESIFN